jgi:hypothetical protein
VVFPATLYFELINVQQVHIHIQFGNLSVPSLTSQFRSLQSNLDLRTPLYTYFWFTYYFF